MSCRRLALVAAIAFWAVISPVFAADDKTQSSAAVGKAVQRSLPYLEREGVAWIDNHNCISCHHVPFLLWSHNAAKSAGISVDEVKLFKPAPQVYELAAHKLGTRNIAFVSSNCWDAIGAKSYGFSVYWINRSGAPVDRMGFKPDRILKSLDEILL